MDYIIIFFDKSEITVPKETVDQIKDGAEMFELADGSVYKKSSIAKMLPIDEYFQQYPDKRPYTPKDSPVDDDITLKRKMTPEEAELAYNGLRRGLMSYIQDAEQRGEEPKNAKMILTRIAQGQDWKEAIIK